MNRLWVRLTIAFVVVTLIGVAAVALLADTSATDQFRQYLSHQEMMNQAGLGDELAAFYQRTGSWDGVEEILATAGTGMGMGGHGRGQMRGATTALAGSNGIIIYGDRTGETLTASEKASALSIDANGMTAGYLVVSSPGRLILDQAQQTFLDQLRRNLVIAALIASGLAILIGLLISRALATPLAGLAQAARAFAGRDWAYRAQTQGTQEVAEVAHAFNEMAESLQHAEVMRRDMMADIAHELRTPVAVIQGNLRAMLDGIYPLERAEIATLYDETRLLNRLIDDLRELALAEAGQLTLHVRDVNTAGLIQATAEHFSAVADAQGVALDVRLADDLPHVRADADRLAQVLCNLVINALRYTPGGGRVMLAGSLNQSAGGAALVVSVEDTGEGIAADDLPHVFDRFYRGDKSRARSSGGSGLGLAIAKTLIEAMGGRIGVESIRGHGSRFWFSVPVIPQMSDFS